MEFLEISTEDAPTGQDQGVKKMDISTDSGIDTPSVESCQEPNTDLSAWFTTHRDRFIPALARGFSYKREQGGWITQRHTETALADVVVRGAMYRTTCGSQTEPLAADEENRDRKNLAVLRYGHMPWDFDAPDDVEKARDAAVTLVHEILPRLGVQPSQVYIWLSGSKGFHVDIPDLCIGSEAGDRLLPIIYRRMAAEIAGEVIKYDESMYCMGKGKQYRLPNIKRSNGFHKIPLTADELKNLSVGEMQELAKAPRLLPLAPLTRAPDNAPIRELFLRHKAGVWHDELKPKKQPLTLEDKDRFAGQRFACMKYMAEVQDGYEGVAEANVNAYCAMLIAPEQAFFERDPEVTEDLYGDCIMRCTESGSYPTPDDRLDKLRAEIRLKNIRPWSCGAAHKYLPKEALKCGDCIYRQLEAERAFADSPIDFSVFEERAYEELRAEEERHAPPEGGKKLGRGFTAGELLDAEFEPVKWAVDGLLPAGLSILAGAPKLGKSWLVLSIAVAVATGGKALGYAESEPGKVLYLALEDGPRRLQDRLMKLLSGEEMDAASRDRLRLETTWAAMDKGGLEKLAQYCKDNPDLRLIIIDTWARFKPTKRQRGANSYEVDAEHAAPLQKFAENLPVLIITHDTKMKTEDIYEGGITGSKGLPGVADTLMVFKRKRGSQDAELYIDGRDIEPKQLAFHWGESPFAWNYSGRVEEVRRSKERQEVIDLLGKASEPMTPTDIARALDKKIGNIKVLLGKMAATGEVARESGRYSILQAW